MNTRRLNIRAYADSLGVTAFLVTPPPTMDGGHPPMPSVTPMRLLRLPEPFDHPAFVFEPKLDGFRALAHVRGHHCELVSERPHEVQESVVPARGAVFLCLRCVEHRGRGPDAPAATRASAGCGASCRRTIDSRVLHLEHLAQRRCDLGRVACERDLEGIVGKWAPGTYRTDGRLTSWLKIKNPAYTQSLGRSELFDRRGVEGRSRRTVRLPALALL